MITKFKNYIVGVLVQLVGVCFFVAVFYQVINLNF